MRAVVAVTGSESPRLIDAPEPPAPGQGQVLCRTLELGICGTDREILRSLRPWLPPDSDYLILGHECLARIEELGPGTTGVAVGDLVVPTVRRSTVKSAIRVDMLSFGQFIERGIVNAHGFSAPWWLDEPRHLYPVSPNLRELAILTEPLAVAEKGVREAAFVQQARLGGEWLSSPHPRVLVTGLGPIGFAAAAVSLCRGWPTMLYGRDPADSSRAELAHDLGAKYLAESDAALTPADVETEGYDLILECTGSDEVMISAARALASRGAMVWLGSTRQPRPLPLNVAQLMRDGLLRNHVHIGSVNAAPSDFLAALAHLEHLRLTRPTAISRLITARVAPDDSLPHYENREPQGIKTILVYD